MILFAKQFELYIVVASELYIVVALRKHCGKVTMHFSNVRLNTPALLCVNHELLKIKMKRDRRNNLRSFTFFVMFVFAGVYTQYKPFLSKDKTIIKRLAKVRNSFHDKFHYFSVKFHPLIYKQV